MKKKWEGEVGGGGGAGSLLKNFVQIVQVKSLNRVKVENENSQHK